MNLECNAADQQQKFHSRADLDRFSNRWNNPYIRKRELRMADKILEKMPLGGKKILEIGCGEGTNLLYLNDRNSDVKYTGIDFSKEKIESFQGFPENIRGIIADATALPFADNEFDLVFIRDVLHHIDWARQKVMDEAWRVLGKGGTLLIFEGNPFAPLNVIFRVLYPVEKGMKNSTLKKMLELLNQYATCTVEYLEPGYLVRGISFVVWKSKSRNILGRCLLPLADIAERFLCIIPRRFWTGRLYFIKKESN
ncbi:MAG: hypothetical protein A2020_00405 [Lentisphaerae bacterium GWF2_45_14]|nr:MAG: hypothetical protein A2020_00405 [Lentisphaerae bacterium GWF2_45_14]